jgi:predicted transposase/invertase (TIGR01784 family)
VIYIGKKAIDHDRLFKELLETFFEEFITIFFPELHRVINFSGLRFLQQELFTDVTIGDKHRVDLLAEVGLHGEEGLILIHIESQAQYQEDFAKRMFIYFSRLYQKFNRKILPIAIFSYNTPHEEPDSFQIGFPFFDVMRFNFYTLELKKRNWRDYLQNDNPAAAALMSKMGYQRNEKVQVKKEFLRMLVRLQLDPARKKLLTGFFEAYLKLNKREEEQLKIELNQLPAEEVDKIMELTTSWHEQGRMEGEIKGRMEGEADGIIKGRMEGEAKNKLEIARNMLAKGFSNDLIMELTGLTSDEIAKLKPTN